jgi:hypothetical protein
MEMFIKYENKKEYIRANIKCLKTQLNQVVLLLVSNKKKQRNRNKEAYEEKHGCLFFGLFILYINKIKR